MLEIWPEHHATWDAWLAMQNQWRIVVGMAGSAYLGLDATGLPMALESVAVKKKQRQQVIKDLNWMEGVALPILNKRET